MDSAKTYAATIDRLSRESTENSPRARLVVTILLLVMALGASAAAFRRGDPFVGGSVLALVVLFALPLHRARRTRLRGLLDGLRTAIPFVLLFRGFLETSFINMALGFAGLQGERLSTWLLRPEFLDRL